MADPEAYRNRGETERWRELDPIVTFRKTLTDDGVIDDDAFQTLEAEVEDIVNEAVRYAEESPRPQLEELYSHVYKEDS